LLSGEKYLGGSFVANGMEICASIRTWMVAISFLTVNVGIAFGAVSDPYPGQVLKTFPFPAADIILHPTKPLLFASVSPQSELDLNVAVIDTRTWSVIEMLEVGPYPTQMSLTPDGSQLYVVTAGVDSLAAIDTETFKVRTLPTGIYANDVAYDIKGRLWLSGSFPEGFYEGDIYEIDPIAGIPTGESIFGPYSRYPREGLMEISADAKSLYYAPGEGYGSTFFKFDVSLSTPLYLGEAGDLSQSGSDLAISEDGRWISMPNGGGNDLRYNYDVGVFNTSDLSLQGVFDVGYYPTSMAFSPDSELAYINRLPGRVEVFSTESYSRVERWTWKHTTSVWDELQEMIVDPTGRYMFLGTMSELVVLSTGRSVEVPEPKSHIIILLSSIVGALLRARTRQDKLC
jgi:hypothetical protein